MWSQSSPDQSSCSSDTGDLLIRSTRVPPGPGSGPGPVQITVQKLRDPPGQDPDPAAPQPGRDLLTSRFDAGGRGLVLTALSRRSHSVPHRREVKVQLLDLGPLRTSSQNATGVLTEATPLIESHQALRMVTGHATVTSDLIASAPHLQVSHLETTVGFHSNQQPNRAASITMETGPVAMATPHHDLWPEQNSQGAVMRTNETLRETKLLLTPEDSLKTTTSGPDSQQSCSQQSSSQQSRSQQSESQQSKSQQSRSQQSRSQQSQSQQSQSHQSKSQSPQSKSRTLQSKSQSQQSKSQSQQSQSNQSNSQTPQSKSQFQQSKLQSQQFRSQSQHTNSQKTQSHQSPFQSIRSQPCQTQFQLSQHLQSVLVQRRPVLSSTLEEAGLVLRQVRRRKKVLEENLEALLRARTGEVLHCQLDALAANRDLTEEVRIKKTVDAWISTLTKDIQAEMSSEEAAMTSQQKAAGSSAPTGRGKSVVTALRGTGSEPAVGRGSRGPWAEPDSATGELYLARLYGRAPYEGLRRTLKKSPYLRFSSPAAPPSRKPRPRLVESVTGVKVESRKTQTSPGQSQRYDIISSSHLTSGDPADLTVTLGARSSVTMAIPLGRPRTDSSARCLAERQQEVTSPPAAPPTCSVVAVDNGVPELQSQKVEQLDALLPPPPPPPPPPSPLPPPVDIIESKSEEEDVFPGTKLFSVADVVQQEEQSFEGEEEVQLDGGPSPPPVLYQGPVFPPQTRSALPTQDQASVLDFNLQRDVLENRLVEWVEQQLMSRMISEMYRPPPPDHAQNDSTDQSESEEQSATSDIVAVAGGGGLQLFVDSNMSVDSDLIRELVSEVLTEQVTLLLGQRDSMEPGPEPGLEPAEPGPESTQEDKLVSLVPTPVPTPPPSPAPLSPAQSSRETPPLTTPPPSEPTSLLNDESLRPITAPEPVATPTSNPEPAPSTGSPPAVHQAPPPLTWGDVELPLDEERPEEQLDTRSQLLVMSVAEEEPFFSSPLPPPSIRPALSPSPLGPGPEPGPASSSSSPEDSSCTSSSTVTAGPEAALKQISEGELLLSVNQPAAMTEDSVFSFSSSLQELQEMDFDPISEGQVKGHDLLKTKEQRDTQPEV